MKVKISIQIGFIIKKRTNFLSAYSRPVRFVNLFVTFVR